MKLVNTKLRVVYIPQVPMKGFKVVVNNEREAYIVYNALINQHNFLLDEKVIPDHLNVIFVEMVDESGEWVEYYNVIFVEMVDESGEWVEYYNEEEMVEWEEFCEEYDAYIKGDYIIGQNDDIDHLSDGNYIGGLTMPKKD